MKSFFAVILFLFASTLLFADDVEDHCGSHLSMLRDSSGKAVWHTVDEMKRLALKEVPAESPKIPNLVFEGFVSFRVMIGTGGNVLCIWDAAGHPMMIPGAARAIHEWKFKPQTSNGKPVEYVGKVNVSVSNK
jgi:hypothetical protein